MKRISLAVLMLVVLSASNVFADAYVKLIADKQECDVYVNGEFAATYSDLPLEFQLPPGEYLVEVKKDHGDGSYEYYKKEIKVGRVMIKVPIRATLKCEYTEDYYFKRANTIEGAKTYLKKYLNGQYSDRLNNFIEIEYAKQVTDIEGAKTYLEMYPNGKFTQKLKNFIETEYAKKVTSIKGAKEYLSRYPKGKFFKEAKANLQHFKKEEAYAKATNVSKIEQYILNYPNDPKTEGLKSQLGERYYKRIKGLPVSYWMLPEGSGIRSLQKNEPLIVLQCAIRYLKLFPNGKYADEIKAKKYFIVSRKDVTFNKRQDTYAYKYTDNYTKLSGEKTLINTGTLYRNYDGSSQVKFPGYAPLNRYDAAGRLKSSIGSGSTTYYYQVDRLVSSTAYGKRYDNQIKNKTECIYKYNSAGLLVKETISRITKYRGRREKKDKGYRKFSYDEYGNLTRIYEKNTMGWVTEMNYNYLQCRVGENGEVTKVSL